VAVAYVHNDKDDSMSDASDSEDEVTIDILGHMVAKKAGNVTLKIKFSDEDKVSTAPIYTIWADYTEDLKKYIKKTN
jgi:hypothetical protein